MNCIGIGALSFLRLEEDYWRSPFLRLEEDYWRSPFFTTRRGVLEKSFFLINFIGVIFEAGKETREKIWSDFGAEQK